MVELDQITKTYLQGKMEVPVLKGISLSVADGDYLAIMGPSGSGKSTLMNIIGCLDQATSGTYLLDGEDIGSKTDNELAKIRNRQIGFVFQQFNLLPKETALSNVELPLVYAGVKKAQRRQMAQEALAKVGLEDRMNFKPTQLSGGQQQRVAIARAMVGHPKVLLADEPTGALDSKASFQIMELFDGLNKEGVTIIMITHEEEIAECARNIAVLRDGRLIRQQAGRGRVTLPEGENPDGQAEETESAAQRTSQEDEHET